MKKNTILWAGVAAAALLLLKKKASGVGAINQFKAISMAQDRGVDMTKEVADLSTREKQELDGLARQLGMKATPAMAKNGLTVGEALYKRLRTQYKKIVAVSGLEDQLYTARPVTDGNGNVVLIYRDYDDSPALRSFISSVTFRTDEGKGQTSDEAFWATLVYLAAGGKIVWSDKNGGGLKEEVFATRGNAAGERKLYLSILAKKEKGGKTILQLAHEFGQAGDDMAMRDGIIEALRTVTSAAQARDILKEYAERNIREQMQQVDPDLPF